MNSNNPKPGIPICEISQLLTLCPCNPRIDKTIPKGAVKNKSQCDREPDEQDRTGHKPFPDTELVSFH